MRFVRAQAPELVVLSGDITQRARRRQFRAARAFVDRLGGAGAARDSRQSRHPAVQRGEPPVQAVRELPPRVRPRARAGVRIGPAARDRAQHHAPLPPRQRRGVEGAGRAGGATASARATPSQLRIVIVASAGVRDAPGRRGEPAARPPPRRAPLGGGRRGPDHGRPHPSAVRARAARALRRPAAPRMGGAGRHRRFAPACATAWAIRSTSSATAAPEPHRHCMVERWDFHAATGSSRAVARRRIALRRRSVLPAEATLAAARAGARPRCAAVVLRRAPRAAGGDRRVRVGAAAAHRARQPGAAIVRRRPRAALRRSASASSSPRR